MYGQSICHYNRIYGVSLVFSDKEVKINVGVGFSLSERES